MSSVQKFDWQSIFQLSFLPIYQVEATAQNEWLTVGYDFVFEFPQATLVVLVNEETLTSETLEVKNSILNKSKQKAVSQLVKRHQQLYKQHPSVQHKINESLSELSAVDHVHQFYFVGITLITVMHEQNPYPIPHQYGGLYFQEECVIDLDEDVHAMQLFSLHSLLRLTDLLQTPCDFLAYLRFHRYVISQQQIFDSEVELADTFMHSAHFFTQQTQLQQQLLQMGLLHSMDPHLQHIDTEQAAALQPLLDNMYKFSAIWIKLVQAWINKYEQSKQDVPLDILRLLLFPSTYMRMQLLEMLLKHGESTWQQRQQGYICQQRYYSDFGCHYMMVIYGLDANGQFSKAAVAEQSDKLLLDMNIKLANTQTTDLLLLGFDMSHQLSSGDYEVDMDVYHHHLSKHLSN